MPTEALLTFSGGVQTLVVRTNPNYINYSYQLRTKIHNTYGGRVVQILGVNYGTLSIEIESGRGGYSYFVSIIDWFKRTSIWQRNNRRPIRFTYPVRSYAIDVFLKSISISDDLENVTRPLQIEMEIENDFNRILTGSIIREELARLSAGIGYEKNDFNQGWYDVTAPPDNITGDGSNFDDGRGGPGSSGQERPL